MFINQSIMSQTTPAYTFGDCVGSLATISNANIQSPSYWMLDSVLCKDHKRTGLSGEILFFDSVPAYTNFTDNQPLELDIRDLDKLIGIERFNAGATNNRRAGYAARGKAGHLASAAAQ